MQIVNTGTHYLQKIPWFNIFSNFYLRFVTKRMLILDLIHLPCLVINMSCYKHQTEVNGRKKWPGKQGG